MKKSTEIKRLLYYINRLVKLDFRYGWSGDYKSWEEACRKTEGYSANSIMEKVKDATIKVKNGEAVYERDSVIFDKVQYSWPILAALMWVAAKRKGSLSVVDFGGSLGSTYFQNRRFLEGIQDVKWSVVEQENFVHAGSSHIADATLKFFLSIREAVDARGTPDVLLISGTLPFLEKPYDFIQSTFAFKIPHLIIENNAFNYEPRDRITIQKVHPAIYKGSYPHWFLNYDKVKQAIQQEYSILEEYQNVLSIYLDGHKIAYRGIVASLKQ